MQQEAGKNQTCRRSNERLRGDFGTAKLSRLVRINELWTCGANLEWLPCCDTSLSVSLPSFDVLAFAEKSLRSAAQSTRTECGQRRHRDNLPGILFLILELCAA